MVSANGVVDLAGELQWVFAYGSNMHFGDLQRWLTERGHPVDGIRSTVRAALRGYKIVWNYYSKARRGGAANIEVAPGEVLPGVALQLDAATLAALDEKEGHPHHYSRGPDRVDVVTQHGAVIAAWVYVARPECCHATPEWPTLAYRDLLVEAAVAHELPEEHIAYFRQLRVRE